MMGADSWLAVKGQAWLEEAVTGGVAPKDLCLSSWAPAFTLCFPAAAP